MPKNKIQFQKGLSLQHFFLQYGTERQCQDLLFHFRWPQGFKCPRCGHKRFSLIQTRALYQCSHCPHHCSLFSDTIFASTKLTLTTWFLAIYLITQSKDGISSLNLGRTFGISVNAAQRVKHKLQQVMKHADDSRPLPGIVQLDDTTGAAESNLDGHGIEPISHSYSKTTDLLSIDLVKLENAMLVVFILSLLIKCKKGGPWWGKTD